MNIGSNRTFQKTKWQTRDFAEVSRLVFGAYFIRRKDAEICYNNAKSTSENMSAVMEAPLMTPAIYNGIAQDAHRTRVAPAVEKWGGAAISA